MDRCIHKDRTAEPHMNPHGTVGQTTGSVPVNNSDKVIGQIKKRSQSPKNDKNIDTWPNDASPATCLNPT